MKTITFRSLDGRLFPARVKNGQAKLGNVASRLAARAAGYAGAVELISTKTGETLTPDTKLEDLPDESEITMAPDLTPA